MDTLYLLQFMCFIVSSMFVISLVISFFQQSEVTKQYKSAHWMLLTGMVLLAVHYVLQMTMGWRASSDELGSVFNILFYTPMALLVSCSMMRLLCGDCHLRRYILLGSIGVVLVLLTFFIGWFLTKRIDSDTMRLVMHSIFFLSMVYYIVAPMVKIRSNQKQIINDTGGDITQYERFIGSSYLLLCTTSSLLVFAILWRPALYVVAPLLILALFLYVQSFIALGFNIAPLDDLLQDTPDSMERLIEIAEKQYDSRKSADADSLRDDVADGMPLVLSRARVAEIETALKTWIGKGSYCDPTTNIGKLAQQTEVPRAELSLFFYHHLHSTFRIWLSNIRFEAAQRLIKEHPEYSNDTVSSSCGFSSRSQLYKIFSDRVGMSPREWYENMVQTR